MKNKPVAWMDKYSGVVCSKIYGPITNNMIPLYTTPQDQLERIAELEKQLEDLEINNKALCNVAMDFAKEVKGKK